MKLGGFPLRGKISFSLLGAHMDQDRLVDTLCDFNGFLYIPDIMSVDRSQICDPHLLKEHARNHQGFERLLRAADAFDDTGDRVIKRIMDLVPQLNIAVRRADLAQIAGQPSDVRRNRHVIVI